MKTILLICALALTAFAQTQAQIIVQEGETRVLRGQRFENFTGDFVIKNFGTLQIGNSIFADNFARNASLGFDYSAQIAADASRRHAYICLEFASWAIERKFLHRQGRGREF